jgi:hypothetical protein
MRSGAGIGALLIGKRTFTGDDPDRRPVAR